MARKIDLTGQRFGKWTVLEECEEKDKHGKTQWECLCDCGTKRTVLGASMKSGLSNSCGCVRKPDITGQIFGRWRVISKSSRTDAKHTSFWNCVCNCGTQADVSSANLISGNSESCGCMRIKDLTDKKFGRLTIINKAKERVRNNVVWKCKCDCGNVINVVGVSLTRGSTQSCGCLQAEKAIETLEKVGIFSTGKEHPRYNPEISDEQRMSNRYQLHGISMVNWRKVIFNSDDYVCQGCGKRGYSLNAHHLNSWNAFPEQRFDTANGITLCEDCHKEFHHFNGYGDNTLEEFRDHIACMIGEEYLEDVEETLLSRESVSIETRELQTT